MVLFIHCRAKIFAEVNGPVTFNLMFPRLEIRRASKQQGHVRSSYLYVYLREKNTS